MEHQKLVVGGRRTAARTVLLLAVLLYSALCAHGDLSTTQSSWAPWNARVRALLAMDQELTTQDPEYTTQDSGPDFQEQLHEETQEKLEVNDEFDSSEGDIFRHGISAAAEAAARAVRASHSMNGTHPMDPAATAAALPCKPSGVALAVVAVHGATLRDHLMRWMAVANQNAYSAQHGYKAYVSVAPLHPTRIATWQKFLLAKTAFEHSCPEYVWLLDSDAYIMNLQQSVEAALPEVFALPPDERPDVIMAKDCNGLNAGSLLLRNTPWTRQHLSDAWATTQVEHSRIWHEQAALMHLIQNSSVAAHYHFVKQRTINGYLDSVKCRDDGGPYQEGDLVLHFVDTSKKKVLLESEWLGKVPVDPLEGRPAPVAYGVWHAATAPVRLQKAQGGRHSSHMNVTMSSALDPTESLSEEFLVLREPFNGNPGWPLRVPKLLRSVLHAARKHRPTHSRSMLLRR